MEVVRPLWGVLAAERQVRRDAGPLLIAHITRIRLPANRSALQAAAMCPRLYEWLAAQGDLVEFRFPPGGEISFPPYGGYQINAPIRYYRLSGSTPFHDLVIRIDRWQLGQAWTDLGKAVHVWSWRGEYERTPLP